MNVGTPILYTDRDGNEWSGNICGRTWEHHQPLHPKTGQPEGPVVRNEVGLFNVKVWGHDGQERYFEGVEPSGLRLVELDDAPPVFATRATRRPPAYGGGSGEQIERMSGLDATTAAPEIDYAKLAAAIVAAKPSKTRGRK